MAFSVVETSVFAAESAPLQGTSIQVDDKIDASAKSKASQISTELQVLAKHGLSTDFLEEVTYDGVLTYKYQLPDVNEATFVNVQRYSDGVVIEFREGINRDVIDFKYSGKIYCDGKPVEIVKESVSNTGSLVAPRVGTRTEYSDTSFISSGVYYVEDSGRVGSVNLPKTFAQFTASGLASVLLSLIPTVGLVMTGLTAANLIAHATSIKGLALRTAREDTSYLSFTWSKSYHQKNDAFIKYFQYRFTYYTKKDCRGEATTKYLYQRTLLY